MQTFTREQFIARYGSEALNNFPPMKNAPQEQGIFSRIGSQLGQRSQNMKESLSQSIDGKQSVGSGLLQAVGQGAGAIFDPLAEVVGTGLKATGLDEPIGSAVGAIAEISPVKGLVDYYKGLSPEAQKNIDATFNIGSLIPVGMLAKPVANALKTGLRTGANAVEDLATKGFQAGKQATAGAVDIVNPAFQAVKNVPARIKTNLADVKATEQVIKALPPVAQKSVRQGVDIEDISNTIKISPAQKPVVAKLYTAVKDFVAGKTNVNPISAVGKPVVDKFNTLKAQTSKLGNQLDDIADGLVGQPVRGSGAIISTVDDSLAKLKISKTENGLNFTGSNIEGLGTNETIVNNVYRRLNEATDANDLHRLKKYIDDNVTYGKTTGGFTGTAEDLVKGWRKAIDDTLDVEFPAYNKVNTELAQRIKPINDFKRFMKSATGLDEDLMNMSAGQLMRRIASNLRSNPELRQVLRDLDKATNVKGKLSIETDTLVDFFATLEKYYPEIVGKNTFKGQIGSAIVESGSLTDKAFGAVKAIAGQSEAVKRKAITDFLDDFFSK